MNLLESKAPGAATSAPARWDFSLGCHLLL